MQAIPQIFVFNHQLEVGLHRVLVLLRNGQQVFSQLHVAYQHFFDDADARDQSILGVGSRNLVWVVVEHGHCHAKLAPHLVLHGVVLWLGYAEIYLSSRSTISWSA